MMIYELRLVPQQDKRDSILQVFRSIIPSILAKPGCMDCSVFEEYDASHLILYTEQWSSEEELYRHVQSGQFAKILAVMDLAAAEPQVSFHQVSGTSHLELIQTVRGKNQLIQ